MTTPRDIDLYNCALRGTTLIEASAGTGKTYSLCALYLRQLLEAKRDVQHVLVVTFTNAAVAELRERIRGRIVETLAALRGQPPASADPFVPNLLAALRKQGTADSELIHRLDLALQSFDEAAIHTIHVFCQRALELAPFSAGAPLSVELKADIQPLRLAAAQDAWRRHVAAASAATLPPALAAYLAARKDGPERVALLLAQRLAKPLAQAVWPPEIDAPDLPALQDITTLQAQATTMWATQRDEILQLLKAQRHRINGNVYREDTITNAGADWDRYFKAGHWPQKDGDRERFAKLGTLSLVANTKQGQLTPDHPFFHLAQRLINSQLTLEHARLQLLRTLIDTAEQALRDAMRQQRVQSFDDLLHNLYRCISGPDAAVWTQRLRGAYPAAMIDEFQDTDPLQFEIFRSIYQGHRDAWLCMVGDPKQAIYSFRHADLPTYLKARAEADTHYALRENQRSTPALLAALNALYTQNRAPFMQAGLDYVPVTASPRPRGIYADAGGGDAALQVWLLPGESRGGPLDLQASHDAARSATAAEIARLLSPRNGAQLNGEPLRPADIAVLVRTRMQGTDMRRALHAHGIHSVEMSPQGIYQSVNAADLEALLMGVWESSREPLLRAALASTAVGFDASQIDALASDEPRWLAEAQRYVEYRDLWIAHGIGYLLRRVFTDYQLHARMLRRTDGERHLTNYLHLAELLQTLEQDHPAPEALLRELTALRRDGSAGDEAQLRLESDEKLVKIVTIHSAKGLEFPVVFCPTLWPGMMSRPSGPLGRETRAADGRQVIDYRPKSDDKDADDERTQRRIDAAAEELRLQYVALTRAVHRCYVVAGCYGTHRGKGLSTTDGSRSLLNWLVQGDGLEPEEWLQNKHAPETVDAAWQHLAREAGPDIRVAPLPLRDASAEPAGRALTLAERAGQVALRRAPQVPGAWRIGSYSALRRAVAADASPKDHDQRAAAADATAVHDIEADLAEGSDAAADDRSITSDTVRRGARAAAAKPAPTTPQLALNFAHDDTETQAPGIDDMRLFPRGTVAGECVHAVYEHIDFCDASTWSTAISAALRAHPMAPRDRTAGAQPLPAMLTRMLNDSLATELPDGLKLRDVPLARRLSELEFHLPSRSLHAQRLNDALQTLGYAMPAMQFADLHGYLHGFIDAVIEHRGRYYIIDWKSNDLGPHPEDYAPQSVQRAMDAAGYHLQHLLYSLALTRLLSLRVPGYAHAAHYGGVYYLYVRGVRPEWRDADTGLPYGVYFDRASESTIQRLSALLDDTDAPRRAGP